jgi:hypothetical protein
MLSWIVLGAVLSGASDVPRSLPAGSRVRVTMAPEGAAPSVPGKKPRVTGRLLAMQVDSLAVQTPGGRLVIPFDRVARLEVSRRGRHLKRGALIGGLVGFAALSALMAASFDEEDDISLSTGDSLAIGAILGAPAGAAVGLGIGAVASPWHSVAVPRAPAGRPSARLSLTIRF